MPALYPYLFFVVLLAYTVKGIVGFGNTLIMAPLFSFAVSPRLTTPLDLLMSIPTNAYLVWKERHSIDWKVAIPLSAMLLLGDIPGAFLLTVGEDRYLKALLGLVIMGIAIEMLTRSRVKQSTGPMNPVWLWVIGLLSGVLAGLYGVAAPLIAYVSRTTNSRNQFRGTLACVFLADNIFRFIYYGFAGLLNRGVWKYFLILFPAVALGMFLGGRLDQFLQEKTVTRLVIALLLFSGAVLFTKSLL